jgi:hypothetical protein
MKASVIIVSATLTVAILLAASLLIVTGTRGEHAPRPSAERPAGAMLHAEPRASL